MGKEGSTPLSIFGRRASENVRVSGAFPAERNPAGKADADDGALDALGSVLTTLGRMCFELEDEPTDSVRRTFERLAQHVLVGAPIAPAHDVDARRAGDRPEPKDWGGVGRAVLFHRRREVAYVTKSLDDLRRAVCAFTAAFSRVTGEDGKADGAVREQLARLEAAAKERDTAAITREALATVEVVGESIDKRAERHRAELRDLAGHVRQLSDQLEQAKRAGETDGLTRVPNRACFDEFVARTVDLAALSTDDVYLMMIDVDRFKEINDGHGHGAGDAALRAVADRLSRTFPRRGDLVARFGGDEFAVVLRDIRPDEARMLAERVVVAMRTTRAEHLGKQIPLSVSVGIAARRDGDTRDTWTSRADAALYAAKQAGRDRWAEGAP